jgi:hypothetical protein
MTLHRLTIERIGPRGDGEAASFAVPFTLPGEANRLSPGPIAGHVMATAVRVCGRGVVTRVEVVSQQPQRQVRSV